MRQRRLAAQIGSARVDLMHQIEALHLERVDPAQIDGAGVVDEDVDPAKAGDGLTDRRLHLILEANVTGDGERLSARRFDLGCGGVDRARNSRISVMLFAATTTFAPSRAARIAMASPTPRLAPVMKSAFPASERVVSSASHARAAVRRETHAATCAG